MPDTRKPRPWWDTEPEPPNMDRVEMAPAPEFDRDARVALNWDAEKRRYVGPNEWRQALPLRRQELTSLTVRVDRLVLVHARMRALFEGTNLSRLIRQYLDDYAKPSLDRFKADPASIGRRDDGADDVGATSDVASDEMPASAASGSP